MSSRSSAYRRRAATPRAVPGHADEGGRIMKVLHRPTAACRRARAAHTCDPPQPGVQPATGTDEPKARRSGRSSQPSALRAASCAS